MRKNILIAVQVILIVMSSTNLLGQELKIESQNLKGWTKETSIIYADFQGKPNEQIKKLNKEVGLQASAQVGLKSILDVPKRKADRGRLLEKVYVAPFFIKSTSLTLTDDEKELDKQRLYFDMAELFARIMRRDIEHIQDSTNAYGTVWIMYSSIKEHYCMQLGKMHKDYTLEVFVEKKVGAYDKWRAFIDERLLELDKYATRKEDCHRLLSGSPIDPKYKASDNAINTFINCNKKK